MRKIIGEKRLLFKGKFTVVNEYDLKDDGIEQVHKYECIDRGDSVTAMVFNPMTEKYYFVKQFRIGAQKELVELVAGMFDRITETPEAAIVREIEEELGFTIEPTSLKLLSHFYTSPGGLAEHVYLFYVETAVQIHDGGGIDDESIEIISMSKEELKQYPFEDAKTLVGCLFI